MFVTQMTPYGVYDLKYQRKEQKAAPPSVARSGAAKLYSANTLSFYLKASFGQKSVYAWQDEYRRQIVSAFTASRELAEKSERFLQDKWPKLKIAVNGLAGGQVASDATQRDYELEVLELAARHTFATRPLWRGAEGLAEKGAYALTLEKNGQKEKALFYLGAHDNAYAIMGKMADAVNAFAKMGKARIDNEGGQARLVVTANEYGDKGRFELRDDVGGMLGKLGAALAQEGRDGRAVLDGKEQILQSNRLPVDEGRLMLDLLHPGKAVISVMADRESSIGALRELFAAYNGFRQVFQAADKTSRTDDLFKAFDSIFQENEQARQLGVWQDRRGMLDFPAEAAEEDFAGYATFMQGMGKGNSGLAVVFLNMAGSVQKNPLGSYLSSLSAVKELPDKLNGLFLNIVA